TPPATGPATLFVSSSPGAVPIEVDGAAAVNYTPSTVTLAPGAHSLRLRFLGYRDTTIEVTLSVGVQESLTVSMGPGPGTPHTFGTWLSLSANPDDIAVGPNGPVYMTMGTGTRSLLSFSLAGSQLGQASLNRSGLLTAVGGSDAYFAEIIP